MASLFQYVVEDTSKRLTDIREKLRVQYPAVEKLIESENFEKINKSFAAAYEELEKIGAKGGGLKKTRDARKVMKALERTMDLLAELLKLKYELAARMQAEGNKQPG